MSLHARFTPLLSKASYILREEGVAVFVDRLVRASIVRIRRRFRDTSENTERWRGLRGAFRGQRAFLVGNGPSLNRTPLHLLAGEKTMCFNHFDLMHERLPWRPTMLAVIDDRVLTDMAPALPRLLPEVSYAFFPDLHPYNVDFTSRIPPARNVYWLHPDLLTFSDDLPWCGINKTVANVGLQILAFLGFEDIYLLGVDMSYSSQQSVAQTSRRDATAAHDDDPNHFDPRYFGAGRSYHHPRMDETLAKFREAKSFFDERGVRIWNAGVGGQLETFPRVNLRDVVRISRGQELELLVSATGLNRSGHSLEECFPEAATLAPGDPWPSTAAAVICESDDAAKRIPAVIFTHIPFGPFDSKHLFLPRAENGS